MAPRGSEGDRGGVLSKCSVCGRALGCRPRCRRGPFRALNGKLTSPRAASGRVSANRRHWDPGGGVGPERGSRLLEAVASTNLHEVTLWSSRVPTARLRAAPLPDAPEPGMPAVYTTGPRRPVSEGLLCPRRSSHALRPSVSVTLLECALKSPVKEKTLDTVHTATCPHPGGRSSTG